MEYDLSDLLGEPAAYPEIVHESQLAALLGISRQAIGEHVANGVLKRAGRAQFDLAASVKAYCAHLRLHAGRAGRPSEGGDVLKAERLRLTKAQAEAQEAKNRLAAGEMVSAEAVGREWQTILRDVRAAVLAVPSRYGATMPHLTANDVAALDREIRAALEGLADGNA
ncbi:terminase small subunit [Mesorhizobium huakuii]|uniref:Terminase small subunit n=1 Tax=Mesorhizobium huakuii TaxID=28104 RepID=A0ABZ0VTK2_9HYPH|nr:terminase small subunit [Mesorhizobium huakuii]WQB99534.1 terminase small subunit [Mesorhizobium huakuii]